MSSCCETSPSALPCCWSAGCATWRISAACVRLPIKTIFTKYCRRRKFMVPCSLAFRPIHKRMLSSESEPVLARFDAPYSVRPTNECRQVALEHEPDRGPRDADQALSQHRRRRAGDAAATKSRRSSASLSGAGFRYATAYPRLRRLSDEQGATRYTSLAGTPELREAIAANCSARTGSSTSPRTSSSPMARRARSMPRSRRRWSPATKSSSRRPIGCPIRYGARL